MTSHGLWTTLRLHQQFEAGGGAGSHWTMTSHGLWTTLRLHQQCEAGGGGWESLDHDFTWSMDNSSYISSVKLGGGAGSHWAMTSHGLWTTLRLHQQCEAGGGGWESLGHDFTWSMDNSSYISSVKLGDWESLDRDFTWSMDNTPVTSAV